MHSCTPRFSLRCSLSFQPMQHPACSCPPLAPCWTARLGRLGASLPCSRWRISKHRHNPCSCCFSDRNQLKYVNYYFFNCSSSHYHEWFQLSYTAYVEFLGTSKKVQIHTIICYKALLFGTRFGDPYSLGALWWLPFPFLPYAQVTQGLCAR